MKKRFLAMFLALTMCLALLPTAALAKEARAGDTTVEDSSGIGFDLSKPLLGTKTLEFYAENGEKYIVPIYVIPEGTIVAPKMEGTIPVETGRKLAVSMGDTSEEIGDEFELNLELYDWSGQGGNRGIDKAGISFSPETTSEYSKDGICMIECRLWISYPDPVYDPSSPIQGNGGAVSSWVRVFVGFEVVGNDSPATPDKPVTPPSSSDDFEIDDKGVLVKYKGKGGDVVIPDSVTSIGDRAFAESNLTSVVIKNGVVSIGRYAFEYCHGLTSVTIPNSVTSIGDGAFEYCDHLTSMTIPNNVTSIGSQAFESCTAMTTISIGSGVAKVGGRLLWGCKSLATIQVDSGNKSYTAVDNVLFTKDMKTLVVSSPLKKGVYAIPGSVTSIGDWAFLECTGLTSVTIPNSVTSIGGNAFMHCTGLTSVTIPNSVTSIGRDVFFGCTSLANASVSSGMTKINDSMFDGCTALTEVSIPASVTRIETRAFMDCSALKDVYYGGSEAQWKAIYISVGGTNKPIESATIHYNSTLPDQPVTPDQPTTLPTVENIPAAGTAVVRTQSVLLDGKTVQFQYYAVKNAAGNETNYVKLRDLAQALNGTKAQFNVGWDGKISITSNTPYVAVGGEGSTPYTGDQSYKAVSDTPVSFNGSSVNLTSFSISYQGGGYTYYKLRDLGQLLNFNVMWNGSSIVVESDKPYTG